MSNAMASWWQTLPSRMDPFIVELGPIKIGWYGMMYVVAFVVFYLYCRRLINKGQADPRFTDPMIQDYLLWAAFGLIIGARLGYALFYNFSYYMVHPLEIIMPFDPFTGSYTGISGMSYHGGLIGSVLASVIFFRRHGLRFLRFAEDFVSGIPIGYMFGRLGNFINGELYGRATTSAWGMYFPGDPTGQLRHPSQLYEAFGEGIVLFILLNLIRGKGFARGLMFPIYLMGYGVVRFIVEFFRQPDAHLGFVLGQLSQGQMLCIAMIVAGGILGVYQRLAWRVR